MTFTNRITVKDVRTVFGAYADTLKSLGVDVSKLELQEGSQANGRAYRIVLDGFEAPGTGDRGYIGWTAREAYDTIQTIRKTMSFFAELKTKAMDW
jgi:hypothetical protein